MERLISRVRRRNAVILRWEDRYDKSNSLSALRIRQKLLKLMGTDVIRLNDRNYTETLLDKLKQEYESNLDKKEKALEKAEKQRLRKLMLDGIISASVMKNPAGKQHRSKRIKHNSKDTNKKVGPPSIMHEDSPYYQAERPDSRPQPMDHKQSVVSQMEHTENKDSEEKHKENLSDQKDEDEKISVDDSMNDSPGGKQKAKKQVQWSQPKKQMNSGDGPVSSPKRVYPKGKFSTKESPLLRNLREEETVAGLYRLAEKLVL
ncbi:uncharacterized protein LOC117320287 isoform X2 [Pecten maximus]|uniref:uncharacterized protein LOC117320287 isoform X2 n=1 Tax=Pecten maximus TaxID=6579 RepID=UPI0014585A03|nr:uncharacterized protein LOC117320287 isoform X2 [Pecten maximus]